MSVARDDDVRPAGPGTPTGDEEVVVLPASFAQERLWFLDRFEPESIQFNIPVAFHLRGRLDVPALKAALRDLVERHESLRTTFAMEDGRLYQVIATAEPEPLLEVETTHLPPSRRRRAVRRRAEKEARTPFDLARGPLFRATLVRLDDDEHALLLTLHHVIADGWSLRVLYRDLESLYDAHRLGVEPDLPQLEVQYADYAVWQRETLRGEVLEEKVEHWRRHLEGAPSLLALPADRPRPSVRSHAGDRRSRGLPPRWGLELARLAKDEKATAFMVLTSAFLAVVHHHTHRTDLVVGTAVANRGQSQVELLVGFFVNTLPLRTSLAGDPSFRQLVARVKDTALDAFAHQDLPFERLVEELAPERNPSHTPLIQLMFLFEEGEEESLYLPELDVRPLPVDTGTAKYDVGFAVVHRGGRFAVRADYNTDLYDATTVDRLLDAYRTLLGAALADPERPLSRLPVLTAAQRHQLLRAWNDTAAPLPPGRLHDGFEEQAAADPGAPAVVTAETTLSYGGLERRANRLAHLLRRRGVGPGVRVGVHLTRTPRLVEAVLAVHKAGGAYVPLEAGWPADRVGWILDHHRVDTVLVDATTRGNADGRDGAVDLDRTDLEDLPAEGPPDAAGAGPEDPAYVIFTSGSTGRPKGVMVRHRPAVNLIHWVNRTHDVGPGDRLLFVTSLAFDLSVYDVFGTLAAGATVRLAGSDEVADPQRLVRLLRDEPITFWDSAPAALQQCVPYFDQVAGGGSLRLVFLSGDWIPLPLPDQVRDAFPGARVVSLGGATEATVWSNHYPVGEVREEWSSIPYGRPIANARYHVLDPHLRPCPVGVPGDLYIGGPVLSTGYSSNPRLTAVHYLPDPLSGAAGHRLYRTGDRARYRPDGNLEFLGRLDNQVKVRGYRIELGEIEAVLGEHPGVDSAVVLAREDTPGNQRLVAYYQPDDPARAPDVEELRELAAARLPDYMLPAAYVERSAWPLSATGKLDREALPAPEEAERAAAAGGRADTATAAAAPTDRAAAEAAVLRVWRQVLERDDVSADVSFFEQGGNSLLMTRVHVALQEIFRSDLPMVELFRHPTAAELAEHLAPEEDSAAAAPQPVAAGVERPRPGTAAGPVAVIGVAGRFPGAAGVEELWRMLVEGRHGIRTFSDRELLDAGVDPQRLNDPKLVRSRGALDDADGFDARFFGLSPREAQVLDPQQRGFLETAWAALEDAGRPPAPGAPVGVFAGVSDNGYDRELLDRPEVVATVGRFQITLGNQVDYAATRLAYELDLTGPALSVQTACSTSLVAVHLACRALLAGDCDLAVAGGSSVQPREVSAYRHLEGGIDSPDGFTRAFDADAAGTSSGSGVAAVVLKRLDDALADGDAVRAVIRATAVNNDGGGKMGFTAPSSDGQAAVIRAAQRAAGVEPATVGYVEAHGTGTAMGDPIEIAGLKRAWRDGGAGSGNGDPAPPRCGLGSVKTNIGHLDAAAGVAGLIKTVLAVERGVLPPSLHFRSPNPELEIEGSPFYVVAETTPWPDGDGPRRAGVSSFGIGGTNAHAVVEQPPAADGPETAVARPAQLLRLSARTPTALAAAGRRLADRLAELADEHTDANAAADTLADVAHTLEVGRRPFPHRRVLVARSLAAAAEELAAGGAPALVGETPRETPPVAFLFPGQGSQYPGMAAELYAEEPVFRDTVDRCRRLLDPALQEHLPDFDLRSVLFPLAGEEETAAERLTRTEITQPALFVVEYAVAELLESWGVRPAALLGHSIGEYVAAARAGVFELADALALVAERGRLMGQLPAGSMLAVRLPPREVAGRLESGGWEERGVVLATVNSADAAVVSGPTGAVDEVTAELRDGGVEVTPLHTSHAFHSPMMEPILEPFAERVAAAGPRPPRLPVLSNLTGTWLGDDDATDPDYWGAQLRHTVRFADGLETLLAETPHALVEVGPGRALSTFARRHRRSDRALVVARTLPHPKEGRGGLDLLLESVGRLWIAGVDSDPDGYWADRRRRRIPLPAYPFEHRRYSFDGFEAPAAEPARDGGDGDGDGKDDDVWSDTERAIAELWGEMLGVASVGRHDDFFDLGGSSLMGVGLAPRLESRFDVTLPSSFLLEAPTVGELAELVETRRGGDGEAAAPSCRVRLQKGAPGRPPLFLVHQVGGNVFTFRALGKELGDDQPLFGLRSRGLEAGEEPCATIGAMAAEYLALLREEQPAGPLLLGGASMGGMVAWEMARRLHEEGAPPALLVLMDTPCGDQMPPREANAEPVSWVLREQTGAALDGEALRGLPFDERWQRAVEEAGEADGLEEARRRALVLERNVDALYRYRPEALPLRLLFFRAAERRDADPPRPELPWIELARGGCETVVVPGDHETMHRPPHVETMAAELRRRLDLAADDRARRLFAGHR